MFCVLFFCFLAVCLFLLVLSARTLVFFFFLFLKFIFVCRLGMLGAAVERVKSVAEGLAQFSLDERVAACGATARVRPSHSELEAVKNLTGFSHDGAVRVLRLRERLIELSETQKTKKSFSFFFFFFFFSSHPKD